MKRRPSEYVHPGELTAYERWELPALDEQGNEVPREEERDVTPLTAGDLEDIRKAAFEDGREEGYRKGHEQGLEEGRKTGHEEGFQSGHQKGEKDGHDEALTRTETEVNAKLARLEAVMGELLEPISRHQDEVEASLVNLTTALARAVVYRELIMDSSQIRAVVRDAVSALPSTTENVRIRVHPTDLEQVQQVAERLEAEAVVIEDESILAGGCKVETRHSLVDFTVEKRFQKAVQGMLDRQLETASPGESAELDAMMGELSDYHQDVLSTDEPDDNEEPPADDNSAG